jgi:hypothetical protein
MVTSIPPVKVEPVEQYVAIENLTVWSHLPKIDHRLNQTRDVKVGEVIPNPRIAFADPADLDEDGSAARRRIARLLELGSIARKADVDSGAVVVPAESSFEPIADPENPKRIPVAVERRPQTVLQKINRMRELDGQGPIENVIERTVYREGRRIDIPLLQREVQPFDGPGMSPSELVPAARSVN